MTTYAPRPPEGRTSGKRRTAARKPKASQRPGFIPSAAVFAVFGAILPVILFAASSNEGDTLNTLLSLSITVYSAAMIAVLCYRGAGRIIRLAFFIFCYVFMGLAVFVQVSDNSFPLNLPGTGAYTTAEIRRTLLEVILGMLAFEIGSLLTNVVSRRSAARGPAKLRTAHQRLTARNNALRGLTPVRVPWRLNETRIIVLGAFGVLFTAYLIAKTGIHPFFDSRQAAGNAIQGNATNSVVYKATNKSANALLHYFSKVPTLISFFAILYLRHHKLWRQGSTLQRLALSLLFPLLCICMILVNNPISNSRFWFGTVMISLVSIYFPMRRDLGIRLAAISAVTVLLFGFTTLQAFRRTGGPQDYSSGFRNDLLTSGTYSEFVIDMVGHRWVQDNGRTDGRQLLGAAGLFVPRSVWKDKPVDTGNLILPYVNPAASLWTEGQVEAGWFGVVLYFGLLGGASGALDKRLKTAVPGSLAHAAIPIAGGFTIFVLRGSLLSAFGPGYVLGAALVFISFARQPKRQRTATGRLIPQYTSEQVALSQPAEALGG